MRSRSSRSTHGGAGSLHPDTGSGRTGRRSGPDITALLKADHRKVARLFEQFENAKQASRKRKIFARIQSELDVHARLEEQIFYRESEEQGRKKLLEHVEEAHGEHKVVKQLLRQADGLDADSGEFDGTVAALKGVVEHHVEEEEGELFAEVRKAFAAAELREMGARMAELKRQMPRSTR